MLSQAGLPSTIVRFPCTYPPDSLFGRMLAGMGVPNLRGGQGTSTFYSSDHSVRAQESENVVPVRVSGGDTIWTRLVGPRDPKTGADFRCEITLHLDQSGKTVFLASEGRPKMLTVKEGEWSDWLRVKFKHCSLSSAITA